MTVTAIPAVTGGGNRNVSTPRQNYWAERRAWWRDESRRSGTDWPSILLRARLAMRLLIEAGR